MNCELKLQKIICQIELPRSLLIEILLIRSWGKAIAGLCSDASAYANNFLSVQGAPSVMCGCSCSLNFVPSLQAELVDVQYGTMEDLIRIQAITNVTKKIALLKLGQSPLLYKVSYTSAELFIWWVVVLVFIFGFKL